MDTIEELIRDAEAAAEPGMQKDTVLHRGDEDVPAPMTAAEMTSAGWVYIYDTRTGERSICNKNNLAHNLKKKRDDGSLVFTTKTMTAARGTYKCLLHPDDPNRKHYDDIGLPTCPKSNLNSPFQVNRHMQKRHKQEWATIQEERQAAKEQRDREFQERLLMQATGVPQREFKKKAE